MSRLVSITAYAVNSTSLASASPMALNADTFISVTNASLKQRQTVPSASGSINSRILTNVLDNNEGTRNSYLVAETISALVTASA